MRTPCVRLLVCAVLLAGPGACGFLDSGPADTTTLNHDASGPQLRVAIIGNANDPRIPAAREAIAYWNHEFLRLGRRVHFDTGIVVNDSIPDELLRAASGEATLGFGTAITRLRASLATVPADIVIALSHTDLISFSVRWKAGGRGVAAVRRSDIPPLSIPNTVRNVIAHEVGHVLGLDHNTNAKMLMCGRPAACRPAAFASDSARLFPLTAADDRTLQKRWP